MLEQDEKSRMRPIQDYGFPSPSKVIIERYIVLYLFSKILKSQLTVPEKEVSPVFLLNQGKEIAFFVIINLQTHFEKLTKCQYS